MYMLLYPRECNIQFISTEPEGCRPEGKVLVNRILHKQGCNNKFIFHSKLYSIHTAHAQKQRGGVNQNGR